MEHGKPHDWNEEELKEVQLVLMKNQVTQGVPTIGGTVETNTQIDLGLLRSPKYQVKKHI